MGFLWDSIWDSCGILVGFLWDSCGILVGFLVMHSLPNDPRWPAVEWVLNIKMLDLEQIQCDGADEVCCPRVYSMCQTYSARLT